MKTRTVMTVLMVAGLLILAFISGNVFAQNGITSSADPEAPKAVGKPEVNPVSSSNVSGEAVYSTPNEQAPNMVDQVVDGNEFRFSSVDGPAPSSKPLSSSGDEQSTGKFEPLESTTESVTSALSYNSTIRFTGSTLKPRENDVNYQINGDGGCVFVNSGDVNEVWSLPLSLPSGAIVSDLRMFFYDDDAVNTMEGYFTKYDLYGNIADEWSVLSVTGGYSYTDVTISPAEVIDYDQYSYVLGWRPKAVGSNNQLCGFRVFYMVWDYGFMPLIHKN